MARAKPAPIPLTTEHIVLLDRQGPSALARRSRGFFTERLMAIAEIVVFATSSLMALWLWAAPPLSMLLLLLGSMWIGILGEWAKALLLRDELTREMAAANADRLVWEVSSALMAGREKIEWSEVEVAGTLRAMLIADVICAAAATVVVALMLRDGGHQIDQLLTLDPGVLVLFAATFTLQVAGIVWVITQHRLGRGELAPPRSTAGLRGLAAMPLAILMFAISSEGQDLRNALTLFNAILLLVVAPILWALLQLMRQQARWLATRLSSSGQEQTQ